MVKVCVQLYFDTFALVTLQEQKVTKILLKITYALVKFQKY